MDDGAGCVVGLALDSVVGGAMSRASRLLLLFGDGGGISPQQAYINKVVALSPIAYWPLDDASGSTARDASGNGRTGTYSNVTLGATGPVSGGAAASFNGSTSFVNVYSASLAAAFNGAEVTLMGWAQATNWVAGVTLFKFGVNGNNDVYIQKNNTSDRFEGFYVAGATTDATSETGGQTSTAWRHAAITVSKAADQMRLYVNGVQVGTTQSTLGTWAGTLANTRCVIGAADTALSNPWLGNLAHVAVFTRALSAADVLSLATVS
jgi:hypothetical protein